MKQVWVATKIHGCEKWSFKSHHGKYLGCDKHGILSATREAISPEEEFVPVRNELGGGRWALQTVRERFVGVDESGGVIEVRGDAESVGFGETWRLRLQKRNKKKTKGVGTDGKIKDKITRKELEELAGVKLDDDQVKTLKRSRRGIQSPRPLRAGCWVLWLTRCDRGPLSRSTVGYQSQAWKTRQICILRFRITITIIIILYITT